MDYEEEQDFLYVEDNPGLIRDKASKAIINIDHEAYERYKERKAHQLSKDDKIDKLQDEIENLKNMIYNLIESTASNHK